MSGLDWIGYIGLEYSLKEREREVKGKIEAIGCVVFKKLAN